MIAIKEEILDFSTPKSLANAFSGIFTYLKLVLKFYNFIIFHDILCKTYDKSLQKQVVNMDLQCSFWIPIAVTQLTKRRSNLRYILEFLQKTENLDMFPSKREISRSNRRTGDNLSKREGWNICHYDHQVFLNYMKYKLEIEINEKNVIVKMTNPG